METKVDFIQFMRQYGFVVKREKLNMFQTLVKEDTNFYMEFRIIPPDKSILDFRVIDKKEESIMFFRIPLKGFEQNPDKWMQRFFKELPPTMVRSIMEFIKSNNKN